KRDGRPLAEIGRSQPFRPHPVVRLVKFEIGRRQHRQSNYRQGDNEEPNRARCAHTRRCGVPPPPRIDSDRTLSLELAIKLGWRAKTWGAHFRPALLQINSNKPSKSNVSPPARKNVAITSLG